MDNQKDIQNTAVQNTPEKKEVSLSVFNGDAGSAFIYKKTERLATALYLITNFFSDNEPMKWNMRSASSTILSDILTAMSISGTGSGFSLVSVKKGITHLATLVEIAHTAGLISPMNHTILLREFTALINLVDKKEASETIGVNPMAFGESFFHVKKPEINSTHADVSAVREEERKVIKDNFMPSQKVSFISREQSRPAEAPFVSSSTSVKKTFTQNIAPARPAHVSPVEEKKTKRVTAILALVTRKSKVSVKDIADVVKGCSEKTLQRELLALVAEGVLKKEGERRWSTYSLAFA
ncbi:MAG: hypothetical protein WC757_01195 [Candidatus Paceibacterota bacterium]|jgi:hypothetical protein